MRYVSVCREGLVKIESGGVTKVERGTPRKNRPRIVAIGDGKNRRRVDELVLEYVDPIRPRPPGMEAIHLDGDLDNSAYENLRWGTMKERRVHYNQVRGRKSAASALSKPVNVWPVGKEDEKVQYPSISASVRALKLKNVGNATQACHKPRGMSEGYIFEFCETDEQRDTVGEEWRTVAIHERDVRVSNYGRVVTERGIKTYGCPNNSGYMSTTIRGALTVIHRIVAMAWCDPATDGQCEVNHKNGIKTDNRAENLEWCTAAENRNHCNAELNPKTNASVRGQPIEAWLGDEHWSFDSARAVTEKLGIPRATIMREVTTPGVKVQVGEYTLMRPVTDLEAAATDYVWYPVV